LPKPRKGKEISEADRWEIEDFIKTLKIMQAHAAKYEDYSEIFMDRRLDVLSAQDLVIISDVFKYLYNKVQWGNFVSLIEKLYKNGGFDERRKQG